MESESIPEYTSENHTIFNKDGYILTLTRIRQVPGQDFEDIDAKPKPTVLFLHGHFSSDDDWLLNDGNKPLPLKLLAAGYDIWLASLRGSPKSKVHHKLSNQTKEFWDFSIHEIGCVDVPAIINYILITTKNESLYCIGFSSGCLALLIAISSNVEYNSKVKMLIALAPAVAGIHNSSKIIMFGAWIMSFLGKFKWIYQREIFSKSVRELERKFFFWNERNSDDSFIMRLILKMNKYFCMGAYGSHEDDKFLGKLAEIHPASTSCKNFCHLAQTLYNGKIQQYDYGRFINLKRYGQPKPPLYDFGDVTVPIVLFSSEGDRIDTTGNVEELAKKLPNVLEHICIAQPNFEHMDFVNGKDADKFVCGKVVGILDKFENKHLKVL